MAQSKLHPVNVNGHSVGYVSSSDSSILSLLDDIVRRAVEIERLQHQQREAVRRGEIPPCPWDSWKISDRH